VGVFRFANRVPLLYELGSDVVTQTANRKITYVRSIHRPFRSIAFFVCTGRWSNYKIDPRRDKVCVFVSIVCTKIPFKGTSKEYIGDDIEVSACCDLQGTCTLFVSFGQEFSNSVKRAIQGCAKQLRGHVERVNAEKERRERAQQLLKVCSVSVSVNVHTNANMCIVHSGRSSSPKSSITVHNRGSCTASHFF
jgi:DNA topoisomerase VI subunit B